MARTTIDFGIDLGTTNSCIAVLRGAETEIIKNDQQSDVTPSIVAVNSKGRRFLGAPAKNLMAEHPDWGAQEFKRQMGSDFSYRFSSTGERATPEQLSSEILKALRDDGHRRFSETVEAAVITIPAIFKNSACEATRKAAQLAGLTHTPLLQEPVAAALAYGFQSRGQKGFWLVYDLGGGTFDAAVIQVRDEMIHVVNHGGNDYLGGKDLDWALVENILIPAIHKEHGNLGIARSDPKWGALFAKLKSKAEEAKIALSTKKSGFVELLFSRDGGPGHELAFEYELTREEVEQEAEPLISETVQRARAVLAEKRLGAGDVEKVLLVGGPTLMPFLRQRLADPRTGLGIPLEFSIDPMAVVARGAAVFAGTQFMGRGAGSSPRVGEYHLQLEYKPVGSEVDPLIGGKAISKSVTDFSGYTVQFVRQGWTSGKIPLRDDGTFFTSLFAELGKRCEFEIRLQDASGRSCAVEPDRAVYTVGLSISEQPLTCTVGVALASGEFDPLIVKGAALPAKKMRPYRTIVEVQPGARDAEIRIVLLQGEERRAARNMQIGTLIIPAERIDRTVPAGSEVEITLEITSSQTYVLKAYIPLLDEDFDVTYAYQRPTPVLPELQKEFAQELDRLKRLESQATNSAERVAQDQLDKIRKRKLIDDITSLLKASEGDQDAIERARGKILDLQLALDGVEESLNWPTLVNEASQVLRLTQQDLESHGKDEDKREAKEIEKQLKTALQAKDSELVRSRTEALASLRSRVHGRQPDFWIGWFQWCGDRESEFREPGVSARLMAQGNRAIQNNDLESLKAAVRQLLEQLPGEEKPELSKGLGSTLTKED